MSTDYYIMRGILKKDILDKTDIKIIHHPNGEGKEFLEDKYGNVLHIIPQMISDSKDSEPYVDNDNVHQLTRYAGHNATYIIDTFVKEFKMAYYGDDGFQNLWRPAEESHNPDVDSNIRWDMMTTHGYTAIDKDTIIIPNRIEDDYKKPVEQNKPIPPIGSTDETYLSNLGSNDEELPF